MQRSGTSGAGWFFQMSRETPFPPSSGFGRRVLLAKTYAPYHMYKYDETLAT